MKACTGRRSTTRTAARGSSWTASAAPRARKSLIPRPVAAEQALDVAVLLFPQPVHPLLEAGAERPVVLVIAGGQVSGHRALADQDPRLGHPAGHQVGHRRAPGRIG